MNTQSPPTTPPQQTTASAHKAAKASWILAILSLIVVAYGSRVGPIGSIVFIGLLLIVVGLALGVVALFGIRKHGTKGILASAIVGITFNGLLLFLFVIGFLAGREMARQQRGDAVSPVLVAVAADDC
jgi:hypothetical protein